MRFSSRTWSWISLLLLVGAALCFYLEKRLSTSRPPPNAAPQAPPPPGAASGPGPQASSASYALLSSRLAATASATPATNPPGGIPHRLANCTQPLETWMRSETALLLENSFIETAAGAPPPVPEHLRSAEDPGSYVLQYHGPLDSAFYALLERVGAEFVSYVPNNGALVRASSAVISQLTADAGIRAAVPFEPYYKLARAVLPLAVKRQDLTPATRLNLVLFPGQREPALAALGQMQVQVLGEGRTPFGPLLTVEPPLDALVLLAQLAAVQRIEVAARRVPVNDLSRLRVGVTTDATVGTNPPAPGAPLGTNYLALSGQGVLVNINDTGVDRAHPALTGRVSSTDTNTFTLLDYNGHGTHVAGTIAGSGAKSETATNVFGSPTNANFAGMAPKAELYVLPIDLVTGPLVSDTYLQEKAAEAYYLRRGGANALISNNSWAYPGNTDYDSAAASFDAAVRDALPEVVGPQPVLYVFAAGNEGRGTEDGAGGDPDTIVSPATAKNVITVGALEQFRLIDLVYYVTNDVPAGDTNPPTITTNYPYRYRTDSDNEVAWYSSRGNTGIGSEGTFGRFKPDVVAPGEFLVSARSQYWNWESLYPTDSPFYGIWSNLVAGCGPYYRYESGTSMAAPVVSGTLALMQEFFERRLGQGFSPALFKALLINGARSVNPDYSFQVRNTVNYQGWGLIGLTNSVPEVIATNTDIGTWPLRFFADPRTNVLATGERHTWILQLTEEARFVPFRATLVWTDPPGNPSVAKKLVNDLDLIVTNLDTGEVFVGNNIPKSTDFTQASATNEVGPLDVVNNVENVYLAPPLGTNYAISVVGRRVHVNAVTRNVADVVQDYALVLSAGDRYATNPVVSLGSSPPPPKAPVPALTLTNGVAQIQQRAGANFQLVPGTNGVVNQWRFYVFTNTFFAEQNVAGLTNGSNVAFLTFLPPNLSLPRNLDADIDLYVSTDAALTNLDATAVANALHSLKRGGTELIVLTNALLDDVFYIGVKAEDQQAAEYGLMVLSTDEPFTTTDEYGNYVLHGMPVPAAIPDGSYDRPQGKELICIPAIAGMPTGILRVIAELDLYHQDVGDLLGVVSQTGEQVSILNGNRFNLTTNTYWRLRYDDSGSGLFFDSRPSDGPSSLNHFIGHSTAEPFLFAISDDALGNTGRVDRFWIRLKPNDLGADGVWGTVLPNQWVYYYVDVPIDATLLTVLLSSLNLPLDLYLRYEDLPTFGAYDKYARINPPGGQLSIGLQDVPPLNAGRYFIGIYNPNAVTVDFFLRYLIDRNPDQVNSATFLPSTPPEYIKDDAITYSTIAVKESRPIVDVQVGVRVDHPRASDLVFHLISPSGARVLLAENRGGTNAAGYGATLATTNVASRSASGGPEEDRTTLNVGANYGTIYLDYEFYAVRDTLRIYYDGVRIFDTGRTNGHRSEVIRFGPGISTNVVIVVNEGGNESNTRWTYTAYVVNSRELYTVFTELTNLANIPIKFATPPFTNSLSMKESTNRLVYTEGFEDYPAGLYPVGTVLGAWMVSLGNVIVHGPTNTLGVVAAGGTNFLELSVTNTPAAIRMELATHLHGWYSTQLAMRRNPNGPSLSPQTVGIYIDGVLRQLITVPAGDWSLQYIDWRADSRDTLFEIRSESGVGPLLDNIEVHRLDPGDEAYFLPEEDLLEPLRGESSFGNWTLEVWDNRAGPFGYGTNAFRLVSWELNFVFANTNAPATLLTYCLPGTNTVSVYKDGCDPFVNTVALDETRYFIVEVPRVASLATNLVFSLTNVYGSSGDLMLLYNPDGLPDGISPADVVVDTANNWGEMLVLDTNAPPLLNPGQRYYLGVRNADPTETNAFLLSVSFDQIDPWLVATDVLTNGVTVTNTIPVTNALSFYQFAVSSNATHVLFAVTPRTGDVDLVVRKALAVADPLPRPQPGLYDYLSENPGTQPEEIVVTGASSPVALEPGVWYLGVFNPQTVPSTYTVTVTEYTNLVKLTNGLPYTMTLDPTNGLQHFQYVASDSVGELRVQLQPQTGNPDLYVRRAVAGPYPLTKAELWYYDYRSTQSGTNREEIVINATSGVPVAPGVWFIGVQNTNLETALFDLTALESSGTGPVPITLTDGVPMTFTVPGTSGGSYFLLQIASSKSAALFELFDLSGPGELLVDVGWLPDRTLYLRSATGTPADPAQIVVRTNGYLPDLTGNWYLWVPPSTGIDLVFTVCATTSSGGVLASGQPLSVTVTPATAPQTGLTFRWNTVAGETYLVETSTDLVNWTEVWRQVATGTWLSYEDTAGAVDPLLFYRIRQIAVGP